jgi:hypothetical protein
MNVVFKKMIPKIIQPLLRLVGPSFFKAMPWRDIVREGGIILRNMTSKDRSAEFSMFNQLKTIVSKNRFGWNVDESSKSIHSLSYPPEAGQRVVEMYFRQLLNPEGLFLDLRINRWLFSDGLAYFFPNQIWVQLDNEFRKSLLSLYKGYYGNDNDLFEEGLVGLGLIRENFSTFERNEIREIFLEHFGPGDQNEVFFYTENFLNSFEKIFRFMVDKKLLISGQFLHLGIYLATLYSTLEELATPINVRAAYTQALGIID